MCTLIISGIEEAFLEVEQLTIARMIKDINAQSAEVHLGAQGQFWKDG